MHAGTSVTSPRGLFRAEILIGGVPRPLYRRHDGRHFAAGIPGTAYTIRVTGLAGGRAEFIVSVDGRHVLDDETADPHRCRGLVTSGSYEFKGWRTSDAETREFRFGAPEASVAAMATGSASNTGVIGIAAHRERAPYAYPVMDSCPVATAAVSYSAPSAAARSADLGTGMGAAQHDPVDRTDFTRDGAEPDMVAIGYATEDALRAMGVLVAADPDPWPGAGQTGYAKYPR